MAPCQCRHEVLCHRDGRSGWVQANRDIKEEKKKRRLAAHTHCCQGHTIIDWHYQSLCTIFACPPNNVYKRKRKETKGYFLIVRVWWKNREAFDCQRKGARPS